MTTKPILSQLDFRTVEHWQGHERRIKYLTCFQQLTPIIGEYMSALSLEAAHIFPWASGQVLMTEIFDELELHPQRCLDDGRSGYLF